MNIFLDEKTHVYQIEGISCPGVTTILDILPKPYLVPWAAKMTAEKVKELGKLEQAEYRKGDDVIVEDYYVVTAKDIDRAKTEWKETRDEAGKVGNIVHSYLELLIQYRMGHADKEPDLPEDLEARNCIGLFKDWEVEVKPKWMESEVVVGSFNYLIGGKFDAIAEINNLGTCLIDFKTSTTLGEIVNYQLAAYQILIDEMRPDLTIHNRVPLHLPKTGDKYEMKVVISDIEADKRVFLSALGLYRSINKAKDLAKIAKKEAKELAKVQKEAKKYMEAKYG